ncbi:hypothetical protein TWF225_006670 [Orbilia oligospora]|uniref:Uncharacterized protein n=1 Tax=Orbilia oligospora TaxID=2813651 RepID=A0A7C8KBY4_ORBOL|nr:hypothetical protein TWF751_007978 [Orbilia oligospora]KAF3181631.1 hypothetical protein TWF225_006670 [Orbilia oligospora]KAF3253266.1 hypothetical protein TWF217_007524 [Orbilia oligospora]KAF3255156.1 hypothetical protein TWF128_005960 [Orbilia oligospora]KAF3298324.1 hypothetical protein TWF132_000152 [Orbilia oligospora]
MKLTTLLLTLFSVLISPSFVLANYESNTFTAPLAGDIVTAGTGFQVRWINLDGGIVNLVLVRGTPNSLKTIGALAAGIPNTGVFNWNVPSSLEAGTDYSIEIQSGAEKNFTPLFTIINRGPAFSSTTFIRSVLPATIFAEKTTEGGAVLTESYPISSPTHASQPYQTIIASSSTIIVFPTPADEDLPPEPKQPIPPSPKYTYTGGKIITLDPSPKPRYSSTTVTYERVIPTTFNGTATAFTINRTRTTSTWITPTAGGYSNHAFVGVPISLAIAVAGLMIVL